MAEQSDIFLWELVRNDDQAAFRRLFDTYYAPLCRYVNMIIRDTAAGEEIVLDIFHSIWENRHRIELRSALRPYLFRSARNRSLNHLRDTRRSVSLESVTPLRCEDHDQIDADQLEEFIQQAILSLPDKCREVFLLSREENLPNQQIAQRLGISVKTVEAQITKALKVIRGHIAQNSKLSAVLLALLLENISRT
ncbi:MAG: RNA polymerase sigma-70 factor [Rikenellaceae bacterium]|nr:RNA polymerase sigma-70 factor [Rikenellaceae bacterium]